MSEKPKRKVKRAAKVTLEAELVRALQAEIREAVMAIEFLHSCLTTKGFRCSYVEDTVQLLAWLNKIAPPEPSCPHSRIVKGCPGCRAGNESRRLHNWLSEFLKSQRGHK